MRNQSIFGGYQCRELLPACIGLFPFGSNWGDVPYYRHVLSGNDEACSLVRTPIATIIPELITDLQNASEKLPVSYGDKYGRATQVAALGFKAKIELYYACWNKNGWPELEGFEPSSSVAQTYYAAAASDFSKVINNYGLTIFGDGNPGTEDKPNYRELFQYYNENCSEIIFSITYGGPSLGQGESLLRDFGTVPPVMHNAGLCLLSAWQTVTNQLSPVISVMSLSCLKMLHSLMERVTVPAMRIVTGV